VFVRLQLGICLKKVVVSALVAEWVVQVDFKLAKKRPTERRGYNMKIKFYF